MTRTVINYAFCLSLLLLLNFVLPRLLPGDPLTAIYGEDVLMQMPDSLQAELTAEYGLDQSQPVQFLRYLKGVFTLDFGYSHVHKQPVVRVIATYLPWSLFLLGTALAIAVPLSLMLGFEMGWRRFSMLDRGTMVLTVLVSGLPTFVLGLFALLAFSIRFQLFPLQGAVTPYAGLTGSDWLLDVLRHAALPIGVLVVSFVAGFFLLSRGAIVRSLDEPFIVTARAKGLRAARIRYVHAARDALPTVVTAIGNRIAGVLVTGTLLIEVVFAYPGMGLLIRNSLTNRDYPVLQGALLLAAVLILLSNFLIDYAYRKLDPRTAHAM